LRLTIGIEITQVAKSAVWYETNRAKARTDATRIAPLMKTDNKKTALSQDSSGAALTMERS